MDIRNALQYSANMGTATFRDALARFLGQQYEFDVDPSDIFTTNGCSQALELACQCFSRPGDVIVVEEPSYHYVHRIFTDNRLEIHPAPHAGHGGLDLDALEVRTHPFSKPVYPA